MIPALAVAVLLTIAFAAPARAADPVAEGKAAYDRKDWPACARLYASAGALPGDRPDQANRYQAAACCAALAGRRDEAFRLLALSAERGLRDPKDLTDDADLASLRDDPRWPEAVAAVKRNEATFLKSFTEPALRAEILAMVQEDQANRRQVLPPNKSTPEGWAKIEAADARHTARMKEIVRAYGWPGKGLVGDDGAFGAWLLVQHADRDVAFQKECLALLEKAVKSGDASGRNLALLTDRVAVAEGRKQVYGSQFSDGEPEPIEDEAHVDERRAAIGLPPMEEYRKEMQERYGTPEEIRVGRVKWFVEHYVAMWDAKETKSLVAMTAPDADGVFITAESPRIWVGFPTMMPAIEGVFRGLDSRKSTVRYLRVKLLPGGKAAVATFLLDVEGRYEGKPFATPGMRITYVLEDRNDRWLLVSAHGSLPVAEADGSAVTTGPDVEAIRALIEQARKADLAVDRSFYERILTDDFSLGTSTGEWETRASKLAYLGSDRHRVNSEAVSHLRVRVHGAAAIATFTVAIDATAIVTQTYVKDGSEWKLAATHASRREERRPRP
jgi:ketosteroid isomerase-like protein